MRARYALCANRRVEAQQPIDKGLVALGGNYLVFFVIRAVNKSVPGAELVLLGFVVLVLLIPGYMASL